MSETTQSGSIQSESMSEKQAQQQIEKIKESIKDITKSDDIIAEYVGMVKLLASPIDEAMLWRVQIVLDETDVFRKILNSCDFLEGMDFFKKAIFYGKLAWAAKQHHEKSKITSRLELKNVIDYTDQIKSNIGHGMIPGFARSLVRSGTVLRNEDSKIAQKVALLHTIFGVMSECSELIQAVIDTHSGAKKDIDFVNVREELQDILWYVTYGITEGCNSTVEEAMAANYRKLMTRYEEKKFTEHAAENRNLEAERKALEG